MKQVNKKELFPTDAELIEESVKQYKEGKTIRVL